MAKRDVEALRIPMNLQFFAEDDPQQGEAAQDATAQEPAEGASGSEETVEALMAKVAQLNATIAKQKTDYDKLCKEEGQLRKALKAKQTAEEIQAEAEAEQRAQHEAYVKELETFKAITNLSKNYMSMGMSQELAEETAKADVDGDKERVTSLLAGFMKKHDEEREADFKAKYADQMPPMQSGNASQVDYTQQFNQAMGDGDQQAAALAILRQAEANGSAAARI